jgi:ribosome modulation factor
MNRRRRPVDERTPIVFQGGSSFRTGSRRDECPYREWDKRAAWWIEGWDAAKEEARVSA